MNIWKNRFYFFWAELPFDVFDDDSLVDMLLIWFVYGDVVLVVVMIDSFEIDNLFSKLVIFIFRIAAVNHCQKNISFSFFKILLNFNFNFIF